MRAILLCILILSICVVAIFAEENNIVKVLMKTSLGDIELELNRAIAPITVDNFVGLAMGTKEFNDPITQTKTTRNYYDGLIFHRVINDFMIQGGCPLGRGTAGPGYSFADECFDAEGKLLASVDYGTICMANAGPNTNGSQFFIVTKKDGCSWLNGKHTVFGKVTKGMDVVHKIESVEKGAQDRPVTEVKMLSVRVVD